MNKRLLSCVLAGAMLLTGCNALNSRILTIDQQISMIDGVISMSEIVQAEGEQVFDHKYMVTFLQPLDWNDPDAGTFPQRVEIGLREGAQFTVLETNGYCIFDSIAATDDEPDVAAHLNANYINIEHRFSGLSRPEDMSNYDTAYWQYLTPENEAHDYHRIYEALSSLLGDKWISYGSSRGGQMTNVYGYFYPEDMLAFVSYVAPSATTDQDTRFYDFVYNDIGNECFGEAEAEQMRDTLLDFQIELMANKEANLPYYEQFLEDNGYLYQGGADAGVIYDLNVLEFAAIYWQYESSLGALNEVLNMPSSTLEESEARRSTELQLLVNVQSPEDWSADMVAWPYYVNAATTYGHYYYDFSYLRDALEDEGLADTLSVTESMEDGLVWDTVFTEEQEAQFVFDGLFEQELIDSFTSTEAHYIMVFGANDPWYSLACPVPDNPNVAVFVSPDHAHHAQISNLPEDMQNEAWALLDEWTGASQAG
ncbi:MAG: hypothetical protein J6127_02075 [Clostridiales bacterium]|nr:hypothetical protein [Clostridiales bacterium]